MKRKFLLSCCLISTLFPVLCCSGGAYLCTSSYININKPVDSLVNTQHYDMDEAIGITKSVIQNKLKFAGGRAEISWIDLKLICSGNNCQPNSLIVNVTVNSNCPLEGFFRDSQYERAITRFAFDFDQNVVEANTTWRNTNPLIEWDTMPVKSEKAILIALEALEQYLPSSGDFDLALAFSGGFWRVVASFPDREPIQFSIDSKTGDFEY